MEKLYKMKTELTAKQSLRLIGLGVPKEKASDKKAVIERKGDGFSTIIGYSPIFKLTDLLEILPKMIEWKYGKTPIVITFGSDTSPNPNIWFAYYDDILETNGFSAEELIDVLYELTIWCIENGHLKFD